MGVGRWGTAGLAQDGLPGSVRGSTSDSDAGSDPNAQRPTPNALTLFGEGPSRILVSVRPERRTQVEARLAAAGVPWELLGTAGGQNLLIGDVIDVAVSDLEETWEQTLPEIMGS